MLIVLEYKVNLALCKCFCYLLMLCQVLKKSPTEQNKRISYFFKTKPKQRSSQMFTAHLYLMFINAELKLDWTKKQEIISFIFIRTTLAFRYRREVPPSEQS